MRLTDWLPLRGRWLRYFVYGSAVLLVILVMIAVLFPVMTFVTHQPPPGWRPSPSP